MPRLPTAKESYQDSRFKIQDDWAPRMSALEDPKWKTGSKQERRAPVSPPWESRRGTQMACEALVKSLLPAGATVQLILLRYSSVNLPVRPYPLAVSATRPPAVIVGGDDESA